MTGKNDVTNIINSAQSDLTDLEVKIQEKLDFYKKNHVRIERPNWDKIFIQMATDISKKSIDAQTKVGSVIVNKFNHVMACGYNSFVSGIDDEVLPNIRPHKYIWMIHSEINAILSCEHRPVGCTIYVTGRPCLQCLQFIAQSGITKIVWDSSLQISMNIATEIEFEIMKRLLKHKLEIVEYKSSESPIIGQYSYQETGFANINQR